jgi:ABC-type transport system involved in multi-copper enzyme maturation permease subunit
MSRRVLDRRGGAAAAIPSTHRRTSGRHHAAAQTAILTTIVMIGKGAPTRGAVVAGNATLELYLTLAATAAVTAVMGLAMSAAAKSQDQILPMLVISVMLSIVFCGGMIPVTGRLGLDQLSWAVPARWGFATSASTTDLRTIAPCCRRRTRCGDTTSAGGYST